jgi:hypothetical protein
MWDKSEEIKRLQIVLKKMGYYSWKELWIYNNLTLEAVYNFQLDYGILDKNSNYSLRWYFWSLTRKTLNKKIKW